MRIAVKRFKTINYLLLGIAILAILSILYFLYHRQRSQAWVYISVSLVRPLNTPLNIAYNSVPYWIGNAISVGDQEKSLLGNVGAIVTDKQSYDWINFGQVVTLRLKVNSTKDRTGVYLYKNTPLLVGSSLDLKLNKVQVQGLVTNISSTPIKSNTKKYEVTLKAKQIESWVIENLKVGDEVRDNKGTIVAKIISFKASPSDTSVGVGWSNTLILDTSRNTLEVVVDLSCETISDECYFTQTQKVKANETIYLPFKSIALNYPIAQIKPL